PTALLRGPRHPDRRAAGARSPPGTGLRGGPGHLSGRPGPTPGRRPLVPASEPLPDLARSDRPFRSEAPPRRLPPGHDPAAPAGGAARGDPCGGGGHLPGALVRPTPRDPGDLRHAVESPRAARPAPALPDRAGAEGHGVPRTPDPPAVRARRLLDRARGQGAHPGPRDPGLGVGVPGTGFRPSVRSGRGGPAGPARAFIPGSHHSLQRDLRTLSGASLAPPGDPRRSSPHSRSPLP